MPLSNPGYYYCLPLQQYFVDKDLGTPLSGGTIYFWEDEANTIPKNVYIQTQSPGPTYSYTNIGSQVNLSSVGTTQYEGTDTIIFLYPYDANDNVQLYYISVFSSGGVLQFTRNAWPPNLPGSSSANFSESENVVSNPQFARVLFDPVNGATINVNGSGVVTPIAPDWNLITTGDGSFTVNQIAVTDTGAPGLPAYALKLTSSGLSGNMILSQTITMSPRLLENGYASGSFIAQPFVSSETVMMNYVPSDPSMSSVELASGSVSVGSYTLVSGTAATPTPASNTDSGAIGYINIQIVIPANATVEISCVQVLSVGTATTVPNYIQESTPRQIDHLFHYYQPQLNFKPIPSLLTGWDFALNPAQFGTSQTAGTTPTYIWDQTIIGTVVGNVAVVENSTTGGMQLTTAHNDEAFFLLQYLQGPQALKTTLSNLAVNIDAYATTNTGTNVNVYLYYSSGSGTIPSGSASAPGVIGTLAYSSGHGVFTLTTSGTTWTQIPQPYGQAFTAALPYETHGDLGFNGFNGQANYQSASTTQNFAIVVTFGCPTSGTVVNINSISCVPGDIPTRPAPQTYDEIFRECQYYYETNYPIGTISGSNTDNLLIRPMTTSLTINPMSGVIISYFYTPNSFEIYWNVLKRTTPSIAVTSQAGTAAKVSFTYNIGGTVTGPSDITLATYWNSVIINTKGAYYIVLTAGPGNLAGLNNGGANSAWISFNYVADARLGVV